MQCYDILDLIKISCLSRPLLTCVGEPCSQWAGVEAQAALGRPDTLRRGRSSSFLRGGSPSDVGTCVCARVPCQLRLEGSVLQGGGGVAFLETFFQCSLAFFGRRLFQ